MQEYIRLKEVARMLDVSERTVSDWVSKKIGPPFVRLSVRSIRFPLEDLKAWLASRSAGTLIKCGQKMILRN